MVARGAVPLCAWRGWVFSLLASDLQTPSWLTEEMAQVSSLAIIPGMGMQAQYWPAEKKPVGW